MADERDLHAAIIASPDDDTPRSVYADWLQERDDPRGEFIALQLAHAKGNVTRAGLVREDALLRARGSAWGGRAGAWFTWPAFERGFLVGGWPSERDDYAELLADPWWPTITRFDRYRAPLVTRSARRVSVSHNELASAIAAVPDLVDVDLLGRLRLADAELVSDLPRLRVVGIAVDELPTLGAAPVIERISTLRLRQSGQVSDDPQALANGIEQLASRGGALRTIAFEMSHRSTSARIGPIGWFIRFDRDAAPGPFTRVRMWWLEHEARAPKELAQDLACTLGIAPTGMCELDIDVGRAMRFPPDTVRRIAARLEERTQLERVNVPFAFAPSREMRWRGELACHEGFARTAEVWTSFVDDLGVHFDSYSVDNRATPALGNAPKQTIATAAARAKTELVLQAKGTANHVAIRDVGTINWSVATPRRDEELAAWFVRTVTAFDVAYAALDNGAWYPRDSFLLEGQGDAKPGWLVALPRSLRDQLAPELARFLAEHPDVRLLDAPSHLVLQIGATAADATATRVREVSRGLNAALDRSVMAQAPPWFVPLALRHLAPRAARGGYSLTSTTPLRVEWRDRGRQIVARLIPLERGWRVFVRQTGQLLSHDDVDGEAAAEAVLLRAATRS